MLDLVPESRRNGHVGREVVATYDYTDEQRALLYQVLRYDPKDFRQRRPDGMGGWVWSLGDVRRVLFGLPELQAQSVVYIVEGEKDVLVLRQVGLVATTNAAGAGKWKDDYTRQLQAAGVESVIVIPDDDAPGRAHADQVARSCRAAGLTTTILPLPGSKDAAEWIGQGHTRDDLDALVERAALQADDLAPMPGATTPAESGAPRRLRAFTLAGLAAHQFPARNAVLYRDGAAVFREGHLGEVYAERGVGKTWFLTTLAIVAATGVEALGFANPKPCHVLYIYGEDASEEIKGRVVEKLCRALNVLPGAAGERLVLVAADWQQDTFLQRLDTCEGQDAIEPFVADADFIIFDNRSCLFDSEGEKDPTAWQPAQDYLLSLRRRGKAVLLGHHSNRQGGARGISKAEDAMNLLLKLTRPEGYTQDQGARFIVTFDKARGIYGAAAAPFIASLTPAGWTLEDSRDDSSADKIATFLATSAQIGERPKTVSAVVSGAGGNRAKGLKTLADLVKRGIVVKHPDGGFCLARAGR